MQTVRGGMRFMRGIGAMGLWVVCGWNRCSEPSQALRASSPGGRAKGLVGVDRQTHKSRFAQPPEVSTQLLPLPPGEVPPEGRGRGMCRQCVKGCRFVRRIGAMVLWVVFWWNWCSEPSQALRASSPGGRAKGGVGVDGRWESQGWGGHRWMGR